MITNSVLCGLKANNFNSVLRGLKAINFVILVIINSVLCGLKDVLAQDTTVY